VYGLEVIFLPKVVKIFSQINISEMFVNVLILNACVKTTEMFICEKILTTFGKKITSNPYTNGYTLLSAV
jgi:hypothetical protein